MKILTKRLDLEQLDDARQYSLDRVQDNEAKQLIEANYLAAQRRLSQIGALKTQEQEYNYSRAVHHYNLINLIPDVSVQRIKSMMMSQDEDDLEMDS